MLTPLQERVAILLSQLPEAEGFALAGGGALIVHGVVDRPTRDLDFFVDDAEAVDALVPVLERALAGAGMAVERVQVNPGFARLAVRHAGERTDVDLCVDHRLRPAEPTAVGPALALEELGANKLLALFSRAEARDFVDVAALVPRFGLEHLCKLAGDKDGGFSRAVLVEMLGRINRLPPDEFGLEPAALADLRATVERWRRALSVPPPGREAPGLGR